MKHKHLHGPKGHCRRMTAVFSDYLDRDLRQRACRKVDEHLKQCPDCKLYLDTLNKSITLYRGLGDVPVPKDVESRLFATIRLQSIKRKSKRTIKK
jgi:predicted anti-sigma-YlaC factor YlaD